MDTDAKTKLIEVLKGYETLMVATKATDGTTHARPMAVAGVDDNGDIWFVTRKETPKVDEVKLDNEALVTGQEGRTFVSVSGHVDVIADRERFAAMWKPAWKVWFPDGKDDPHAVLLKFAPEVGEFWMGDGGAGVRYLFEAARAVLNGTTPRERKEDHAKVVL